MSRYPALVTFIGLTILSACSDRGPTSPEPSAPVMSRGSSGAGERKLDDRDSDGGDNDDSRARRFIGTCETTFENVPPGQLIQIDGICRIRGLGRMTLSAQQTVTPGPNGLMITNTATYTAANGARISARFEGIGTPDGLGNVCFTGTETFEGGTRRFKRASGSAAIQGCASLITMRGFFSARGSIRY